MPHDVVIHVASVGELQHQVELGGRVDDLVQPDHVRVLHQLHELDLLQHLGPRGRVQTRLVDHLDGHLLAGEDVARQLDHGVVALADRLLQVVQAGDLVLRPPAATCRRGIRRGRRGAAAADPGSGIRLPLHLSLSVLGLTQIFGVAPSAGHLRQYDAAAVITIRNLQRNIKNMM